MYVEVLLYILLLQIIFIQKGISMIKIRLEQCLNERYVTCFDVDEKAKIRR